MTQSPPPVDTQVSAEALTKAEEFIEADEGAANKLTGWLGAFVVGVAFVMSAFHLYTAYAIVPTQTLRPVHVGFVLFLCFLVFPLHPRFRHRVMWWDWLAAALAIAVVVYLIKGGDDFTDRNTSPLPWDIAFGIALIVLVLEAMRRSTGWIMPVITLAFVAYALWGPYLPAPWTHKGYEIGRLVGVMYMTLEGIYGVAIDVSSSLIILFTIFGAFLQYSGAGKFYIDFSFSAMGGKPTGAGRTVVLASFLLGGPSGSGVATTVTLGAVAYPMLAKVGYEKNAAGGLLAAGGLGAIISPPVLGAAAFLIAEFLKISYLDVLLMACIPTLLFYLALFLMVEIDARKYGMGNVAFDKVDTVWNLTRKYWFHFLSLVSIVFFMLWGFSPVLSVFWATVVSFATSFLRRDTALISYDLFTRQGLAGQGPVPVALRQGDGGRLDRHAQRRGHLRRRRHHRRRGHAHRPGPEVQLDRDRLRRRLAAADGDLHFAGGLDRRPGGAGDGLVHHLRGHRRAGADQARRARLRRAHVHLLLRGAVRGLAADRAVAVRGRGHHRRRPVQDHAAVLEVHRAGLPGAVHVRARARRPGPAADGLDQGPGHGQLVVDRRGHVHRAVGIAALAAGFQGWAFKRTTLIERWMLIVAGFALVYPGRVADVVGFGLVTAALALQYFRAEVQPKAAA